MLKDPIHAMHGVLLPHTPSTYARSMIGIAVSLSNIGMTEAE